MAVVSISTLVIVGLAFTMFALSGIYKVIDASKGKESWELALTPVLCAGLLAMIGVWFYKSNSESRMLVESMAEYREGTYEHAFIKRYAECRSKLLTPTESECITISSEYVQLFQLNGDPVAMVEIIGHSMGSRQ